MKQFLGATHSSATCIRLLVYRQWQLKLLIVTPSPIHVIPACLPSMDHGAQWHSQVWYWREMMPIEALWFSCFPLWPNRTWGFALQNIQSKTAQVTSQENLEQLSFMVLWKYNWYKSMKLYHLKNQIHYCSFFSPIPPFPQASWLARAHRYDSSSCKTSLTGKATPKQGCSHSNLHHLFLSRDNCCDTAIGLKGKPFFYLTGFSLRPCCPPLCKLCCTNE